MEVYLCKFPLYVQGTGLGQDELMDIVEYSTPSMWQKAMAMHGFDPVLHTPQEFVEFCECLEFTEASTENSQHQEVKLQTNLKDGTTGMKSYAKTTVCGIKQQAKDYVPTKNK